jgi:hypothetical protein
MDAIFLSASVPIPERGRFFETADPFLIQLAVRELVIATIRTHRIVWGGHPAITPMVWAICSDLGADYSKQVVLYQSAFFKSGFPQENSRFQNVVVVEAVENDREKSLNRMRHAMISRNDLAAAVFIGGMDGIFSEYQLFRRFHPKGQVVVASSTGGAARELAIENRLSPSELEEVDFAGLFRRLLGT